MHDENSIVDIMSEGKPVVNFSKEICHIGRVFRFHLTLEPVHFIHIFTLVVSTRHEKMIGIKQLERELENKT